MSAKPKEALPSRRDLANAIRALTMDAVQKANSGHPGAPMGMAEIAEVLWNDFLRHNPANPKWADRDRFVLSNGHGSMLIYSLLHLTGYDLPIDDLKNFRQLHSKTPGHPEYGYAPGVETTTGPLGPGHHQRGGHGAGGEARWPAEFNQPGHDIVDHHTYVFLGDGCLMEGISHEACSLAGTLGLGKLIAFWDDNGISIDGHVEGWFTDDTAKRFEAYGWHVIPNVDGHDPEAVEGGHRRRPRPVHRQADPDLLQDHHRLRLAQQGRHARVPRRAAGRRRNRLTTRAHLGWNHAAVRDPGRHLRRLGCQAPRARRPRSAWNDKFAAYAKAYPGTGRRIRAPHGGRAAGRLDGTSPPRSSPRRQREGRDHRHPQGLAELHRTASGPVLPEFLGGSADLTGSNLTNWTGCKRIGQATLDGNYINYGVREFGMSAIMNGIALHGGFIPFGATFLMFSEYARNALRMAALMKMRVDLRVHPRLHRSGRRRPDPPAGRADRDPAHDPQHERLASLRHGRIRRVAGRPPSSARPARRCLIFSRQNLPHPEAQRRADRQHRQRRLRAERLRRQAGGDHHRHRLRSASWRWRPQKVLDARA